MYLGQPLIDAARMEHSQRIIGASFTRSFMKQIVPPRYLAPFDKHLKNARDDLFQGSVLDWPRHWRATRKLAECFGDNTQPKTNNYEKGPHFAANGGIFQYSRH
ncbi:hypothetical protein EYA82_19900 [Burkholderia pseudomallei]|nr:hypothetical protein EYA82_19900 [Burkholderia pseudomallei]